MDAAGALDLGVIRAVAGRTLTARAALAEREEAGRVRVGEMDDEASHMDMLSLWCWSDRNCAVTHVSVGARCGKGYWWARAA